MFSLTTLIASNILAEIYFIFLKARPQPNLKGFQYQIWTSVKRFKSSNQIRQILACPWKSASRYNYIKGIKVTKFVKEINFEENGANQK